MNQKKILENIIEESIIDYIVEKVIEKIINKSKRGLLLFTGETIGYDKSIESINKLKMDGWEFDVVMSKSAQKLITEDKVRNSIGVKNIITSDDELVINDLLQRNNIIIIPTLTMNSASKIANCISDTLITKIVSMALILGKSVVASINGCCPYNEERLRVYGNNLTNFHKKRLSLNLEILKEYNIKLTSSENLYIKVNKTLFKSFYLNKSNLPNISIVNSNIEKNNKYKYKNKKNSQFIKINKKILSRKDILDNTMYNTIFVSPNTLITDLAKDEAQRLNIKLLKE